MSTHWTQSKFLGKFKFACVEGGKGSRLPSSFRQETTKRLYSANELVTCTREMFQFMYLNFGRLGFQ